jgi:hypothetical protein
MPDRRPVRDGRILKFRSHAMTEPVVLWKTETISCTCLTHTAERFDVRFSVKDVLIERRYFTDREIATQLALEKMHAYNAE